MQNHPSLIIVNENDLLKGRGVVISNHPGNMQVMDMVRKVEREYAYAARSHKPLYAERIFKSLGKMNPPGRVLKFNKEENRWFIIPDKDAVDTIRQKLRDRVPRIIKEDNERKQRETAEERMPPIACTIAENTANDCQQAGASSQHGSSNTASSSSSNGESRNTNMDTDHSSTSGSDDISSCPSPIPIDYENGHFTAAQQFPLTEEMLNDGSINDSSL